jgi:hypothetical protein
MFKHKTEPVEVVEPVEPEEVVEPEPFAIRAAVGHPALNMSEEERARFLEEGRQLDAWRREQEERQRREAEEAARAYIREHGRPRQWVDALKKAAGVKVEAER